MRILYSVVLIILLITAVYATDPMSGIYVGHGASVSYTIFNKEAVDSVTTVNSTPLDLSDFAGNVIFQYFGHSASNDSVVILPTIEACNWNVDSLYTTIVTGDTVFIESTCYTMEFDLDTLLYAYYRVKLSAFNNGTTINPTDAIFSTKVLARLSSVYQILYNPDYDAVKEDDYIPNTFSGDERE